MTAKELWKQYAQHSKNKHDHYTAWQFGGQPDELANLVVQDIKTATCGLHLWYQTEDEPMPQVGDYSVVLNSRDEAVCIIQTVNVTVLPYRNVTADMAYKEGEGDKSLAYWRRVHRAFFTDELSAVGKVFSEDMEVVFEEFVCVFKANT